MCSPLVDLASERLILAGLFQHGKDAYIDVCDLITSDTFTDNENQCLYKIFQHIFENSDRLDVPSVVAASSVLGLYDIVAKDKKSIEFLKSLSVLTVHKENIRKHAKILTKLEFTRKARSRLQEAFERLGDISGNESIDYILSIPENIIFDLISELNNNSDNSPQHIAQDGEALIEHVVNNPSETIGIPTPFQTFNAAIGGGMRRGGVTLIGGYAKAGKSSIGKSAALHVSDKLEIPVLILDTEMQRTSVYWRTIASITNIPINDLEGGKFGKFHEKIGKVKEANARLKNAKMEHIHVSGKPFEEILSIIRRWILKKVGYDTNGKTNDCLVIYDYFKLMDSGVLDSMQEYQALGFQISKLSDFCNQYDFPCLAFVQLNREMDVAQSDRLKWLCTSYSSFTAKTADEIASDSIEAGNRKLKVELARFGPALDPGDYIHMNLKGDICQLYELGTKKSGINKKESNSFEIQQQ